MGTKWTININVYDLKNFVTFFDTFIGLVDLLFFYVIHTSNKVRRVKSFKESFID